MASIYLHATINGQVAGTLWQDQRGIAHFAYDPSYHGAPLSVALPLKNQSFHNTELLPYLFGLLPDSERQRSAIAREFGIRPNNAIAMLEHIGLDCPGGVQFFPLSQNRDQSIAGPRPATYEPLSNHQIALRLKSVRDDDDATWLGKNESWSLGGNQGKFACCSPTFLLEERTHTPKTTRCFSLETERCSHRCMTWRLACPTNYYGAMASSPWVLAERTVWAE